METDLIIRGGKKEMNKEKIVGIIKSLDPNETKLLKAYILKEIEDLDNFFRDSFSSYHYKENKKYNELYDNSSEEIKSKFDKVIERIESFKGDRFNPDELDKIYNEVIEENKQNQVQSNMEQNEKLKNIAEKSLSDTNYLFLFDEKTREEVQKFVVDTAKTQNQLTPQPLTAEDYLAISDKLAEEMSSSIQMTKGMTVTEISEKSTHYYQKYEIQLQKEQEQLKVIDMENNIQQETQKEVNYKELWSNYVFDTTLPLIEKDIYAFLNQGGDPDMISSKMSELLGAEVKVPRYIKSQELWETIVKPFRVLPQEKQAELKNSLIDFLEKKKTEEQALTPAQKLEKMINFYKNEYVISPNKKLTYNDVLAFCYQYGSESLSKLKEITEKILGQSVDLEKKNKIEIVEKIINPIENKENGIFSMEFKNELLNHLQTQKMLKEQEPQKEYNKEEFQKFHIEHLTKLNPNTGLTETNIYAILNLKVDEYTKANRQEMLEKYLKAPFNEIIKFKKEQMIEKVYEIKADENKELQNDFKLEIQKLFLLSSSMSNKNNSEQYENHLKELEYPKNGIWELQHIDKLLTQEENLGSLFKDTSLENDKKAMSILSAFERENKEFLIHTSSFHIGEEQICAKQYLLNVINHSEDKQKIKEQLLENLEESQKVIHQIKY